MEKNGEERGREGSVMAGLSGSEVLLYGGIAVMAVAVAAAIVCVVVFCCTGRKLRSTLEQKYGKLKR